MKMSTSIEPPRNLTIGTLANSESSPQGAYHLYSTHKNKKKQEKQQELEHKLKN